MRDSDKWLRELRRTPGIELRQCRSTHWKIYLYGKLIATMGNRSSRRDRGLLNIQATIRRALRERDGAHAQ